MSEDFKDGVKPSHGQKQKLLLQGFFIGIHLLLFLMSLLHQLMLIQSLGYLIGYINSLIKRL
jgi:EamA domain-containing membrane protein RarD